MRTGHSENTPDADNQRYKTCKRIHGKTVSYVQRGRIHSVNIRIYPISKQRPYLRTLCKPVAQRTIDCAEMGYKKLRVHKPSYKRNDIFGLISGQTGS